MTKSMRIRGKGKNYRKEAIRVRRDLVRAVWELFPYAPFDAEAGRLFDWYFCFEVQGDTLARLSMPGTGMSNGAFANPCQSGQSQCLHVDFLGRTAADRIAEARYYCARMKRCIKELKAQGARKLANYPTAAEMRAKLEEKAANV
ncbi:hypothetical protein FG381_06460 [Sutterella faecalis]|uniref:Uncharacterized protein n=2 Tax=Sutterella TaxID=40544 RepID=A0AAI9SBC7_9BURK|nr:MULTISPECIES: hypothetical protein [Sutterella]KAB7650796.1 hypothetical protein GBM96_07780 [Sutterella seckii]QDA54612.1 hypothetical protein FG381_06460 [Sutterella faecalis]